MSLNSTIDSDKIVVATYNNEIQIIDVNSGLTEALIDVN